MTRLAIAALLVTLVAGACSQQDAGGAPTVDATVPRLTAVAHPNPDDFKPDVAASLRPAQATFRRNEASLVGAQLGAAFGKLGLVYQAHQQQAAAAACFENAIALDATNHRWPYYLAVHHEETGGFADALRYYRQSLAIEPDNSAGLTRLGLLLIETGDTAAAKLLLEDAAQREPDNAAALAGLAAIAATDTHYADAADLYHQALKLQPEASQLNYRLGMVYRQLGDVDKAREALAKRGPRIARIKDPLLLMMQAHTQPAADYVTAGNAALEQQDFRRAARQYSLALMVEPNNADALERLGELMLAARREDLARTHFATLTTVHPKNANGHYYLALVRMRAGERDAALESLRTALAIDPTHERARTALARAGAAPGQ